MKKISIIILCIGVTVLYADDLEDTFSEPKQEEAVKPVPASGSQGSAGSIHSLQGEADWYYSDAPDNVKRAAAYGAVPSHAVFETQPGSWLIIAVRGKGGYIYLGPDTKAKIIYSPYKQGSHWVRVELVKGTVRACCTDLSKLYSCFAVVTPNASVGTSEGGDILVQYTGGEDGTSGVTAAAAVRSPMSVSHIPIGDKLIKPLERKSIEEGGGVKVYTDRAVTGPVPVADLEGKQAFWSGHNIHIKGKEKMPRQKVRVAREIERLKAGEPRLTPHLLVR